MRRVKGNGAVIGTNERRRPSGRGDAEDTRWRYRCSSQYRCRCRYRYWWEASACRSLRRPEELESDFIEEFSLESYVRLWRNSSFASRSAESTSNIRALKRLRSRWRYTVGILAKPSELSNCNCSCRNNNPKIIKKMFIQIVSLHTKFVSLSPFSEPFSKFKKLSIVFACEHAVYPVS